MIKWEKYTNQLQQAAKEVINGLSHEDIEYLRMHPCYIDHHFGFGTSLRNRFVNRFPIRHDDERDSLSEMVFYNIIMILFPEYGDDIKFLSTSMLLLENEYSELNSHYYLRTGRTIPADIDFKQYFSVFSKTFNNKQGLDTWFDKCLSKKETFVRETLEKLWPIESFTIEAQSIGYSVSEIEDCIALCRSAWEKNKIFLPLEIIYASKDDNGSLEKLKHYEPELRFCFENNGIKNFDLPEDLLSSVMRKIPVALS